MPISTVNTKIRSTMQCLSGFELYSRWVPRTIFLSTLLAFHVVPRTLNQCTEEMKKKKKNISKDFCSWAMVV